MQPDYQYVNGRFALPSSARGVMIEPEHRGHPRTVQVTVRKGSIRRPLLSLFRRRFRSAF
jgi:hypothetical protein